MRDSIIHFLKSNPWLTNIVWLAFRYCLKFCSFFFPVKPKTAIFASFGGRKFNDSPRALYDEMRKRKEFDDWTFIWCFVNPDEHDVPRGKKIKIDTFDFFKLLLSSSVWVSNSEMDRGIKLNLKRNIRIETWHGTPLKKICGEENETSVEKVVVKGEPDGDTIRCAQSEFDRVIFARIFHAKKEAILLCDLPRNDELLRYDSEKLKEIRSKLGIQEGKKVILYTPTYREYISLDDYIVPMNMDVWEKELSSDYVLLIRAHYIVSKKLELVENDFVKDVSAYPSLNDLYAIADMMISDYSSTFFDYSILDKPMLCFAYDRTEYETHRGLYMDLDANLPCPICSSENEIIDLIKNMDYLQFVDRTKEFHAKYAPHAGHASDKVIEALLNKLNR